MANKQTALRVVTPTIQPTHQITCDNFGHSWFEEPVDWTPSWGYPVSLRCSRCDSQRRDVYDQTGNLSMRRYLFSAIHRARLDASRGEFGRLTRAQRIERILHVER